MHAKCCLECYFALLIKLHALGLLPVIGHLKCCGKSLGPVETFEGLKQLACGKIWIDVVIDGKNFKGAFIFLQSIVIGNIKFL